MPGTIALVACALFSGACIDAEASYTDFVARATAMPGVDAGSTADAPSSVVPPEDSGADAPRTPCELLLEQDLNGQYFVACLPIATGLPFYLAVNQKVTPPPKGQPNQPAILDFSFTPLLVKATNTAETVGDLTTLPPVPIAADCSFVEQIGTLTLPRLANSLDRELVAVDAKIEGRFVSSERVCAGLSGSVPLIKLDLHGDIDHCVFIRTPMGSPVPVVSPQDYACAEILQ